MTDDNDGNCDNCGKDILSGNGVIICKYRDDGTKWWEFAVCFDCSPEQRVDTELLNAAVASRNSALGLS